MASPSKRSNRCLILVVEDNPIVRRIAQLHLRRYAIDVHTAVDGLEAVEAARLNDYDLILMDVHLPRLNGIEAARQIRESEISSGKQHVPIVAVTANKLEGSCDDAGMDDHMDKPADYERILRSWLPTHLDVGLPA